MVTFENGVTAQHDLIVGAEREIRKALAERLAGADWAPHDLVTLICTDDIDVARPLIAESSVLTDQDLMRLLRQAAIEHQIEVARRPGISEAVVEMILDQGQPAVLTALADNDTAAISDDGLLVLCLTVTSTILLNSLLLRYRLDPVQRISRAMSAPTDSAARSRRSRPGCEDAVTASSCRASSTTGSSSAGSNRVPARKSSYWLKVLANPSLVTTITPPLKPHSPPTANPTRTISTERWNNRLPASRR